MYPSTTPYLVSAVDEILIKGRPLSSCENIWPLLYGRKYLPEGIKMGSAPKDDLKWVRSVSTIIDSFIVCPLGNIDKLVKLTQRMEALLEERWRYLNDTYDYSHRAGRFPLDPGGGTLIRGVRKVRRALPIDVVEIVKKRVVIDRRVIRKRIRRVKKLADSGNRAYDREEYHSRGKTTDEILADISAQEHWRKNDPRQQDEEEKVIKIAYEIEYIDDNVDLSEMEDEFFDYSDDEWSDINGVPLEFDNDSFSISPGYGLNFDHSRLLDCHFDGGSSLRPVVDNDPSVQDLDDGYVWVGKDDYSLEIGDLSQHIQSLTTDSVKDILEALSDEVLFEDELLDKAKWNGAGQVGADLRSVRNSFVKELKRWSKAIVTRHGVGNRGSVDISAAMQSERVPTADIFKSDKARLSNMQLESEVVLLMDASGSMSEQIKHACQCQWVIGSAFEKLGAKVTVIPFNRRARSPLKGRNDSYSDYAYPFCTAEGGTQPQDAIKLAVDIFKKAGTVHKVLWILTDGNWDRPAWCHKIIQQLNRDGVMTALVFTGGQAMDRARLEQTKYHNCKERIIIPKIEQLLPEMRRTFLKAFKKSVFRSLRKHY
jgi:hypothetical protein